MVIYRPHRGGLKEAMAEAKEFNSMEKSKSAYWKMKADGEEPVLMGTREGMVHILR